MLYHITFTGVRRMKKSPYDRERFFEKYSQMDRSRLGLAGAGEWESLEPLLPDFAGKRVLDLGCGSGILSIAALLLGADHAVACDIDEKCMDVAYENAALNGVGRDRYTVRWGDVVTDQALRQELGGPYDVVVANIVADVIKALASTVRPLVKEGGIFLCSGIIDDRAEEVAQCLRDNGWTIAETRNSEGWFSYLCR